MAFRLDPFILVKAPVSNHTVHVRVIFQGTMEFGEILKNYLVPGLGAIIASLTFLSPLKAIQELFRTKRLVANPLPYPMICLNCLNWIFYSLLIRNYFIFVPNFVGLMLGMYYSAVCLTADLPERMRIKMMYLFFSGTSVIYCVAAISFIQFINHAQTILGWTAIVFLCLFYISPLSSLKAVIASQDSSSIDWRLAIVATLNASLWAVYGFVLRDPFVYGPNLFGLLNGFVQMACCILIPRKVQGQLLGERMPSTDQIKE